MPYALCDRWLTLIRLKLTDAILCKNDCPYRVHLCYKMQFIPVKIMFTTVMLGILLLPELTAATKPIINCSSLAQVSLGPNTTILSAQIATADAIPSSESQTPNKTCTFEEGVDVGDPTTIVSSFKGRDSIHSDVRIQDRLQTL